MPQFDFFSFSSQNFWVLFSFFSFYIFILYFYLASFSSVIKIRRKLTKLYGLQKKISLKSDNSIKLYDIFLKKILSK